VVRSRIRDYSDHRLNRLGKTLTFTIQIMPLSLRFLKFYLLFLLSISVTAQTATSADPPKAGADGLYRVSAANLKKLDPSPAVEFPHELSAYEITDTVAVEATISPEGKVKAAKAVSGQYLALKEAAAKTVKKWTFEPYLINGTPVSVRTEITFNFKNTLDHYLDPNGGVPVHLDQKTAQALVVKRVELQYPPEARLAHIQGEVELRVIIGEDGHVHALHIIKGHPLLASAAYNAVRQWEFKPYAENGKNLAVDTNITVTFTIR
jgi:TonB family protein